MKPSTLTITDQFCGCGGSSSGAKLAAEELKIGNGMEIKLAMNHWKLAIETHNTNFPETDHVCTNVTNCDPRRYPSTDILITSPECTVHSPAGGGMAKKKMYGNQMHINGKMAWEDAEDRSRATMWDVPRFAEYHRYNIIIVENVIEARKWELFDLWLKSMGILGYDHKIKYINSQHCHPTPQSRDRMYCVFWKKGNKAPDLDFTATAFCSKCACNIDAYQWFKPKTKATGKINGDYGKYRTQYLFKCPTCHDTVEPYYYAAFNCIDWSKPGTLIGDRLSEKTRARCQYGINKYWETPTFINRPAIISSRYISGIGCRVKSSDDPLPVQVTTPRESVMFHPLVLDGRWKNDKQIINSVERPMSTQDCAQTKGVLYPFMIKNYSGDHHQTLYSDQPLGAVTAMDHHSIVNPPMIVENHGSSNSRPALDRLPALNLLHPGALRNTPTGQNLNFRHASVRDLIHMISQGSGI